MRVHPYEKRERKIIFEFCGLESVNFETFNPDFYLELI